MWSRYDTHNLESVSYISHTHTLLSGNDRKRLLTVTNCFRCCGELKCHKTVCLTHNAYSFECPSHTQSLCAIIVRHTMTRCNIMNMEYFITNWRRTSFHGVNMDQHDLSDIWDWDMLCISYDPDYPWIYIYIRPVHALLETHIHMYRTDHTSGLILGLYTLSLNCWRPTSFHCVNPVNGSTWFVWYLGYAPLYMIWSRHAVIEYT